MCEVSVNLTEPHKNSLKKTNDLTKLGIFEVRTKSNKFISTMSEWNCFTPYKSSGWLEPSLSPTKHKNHPTMTNIFVGLFLKVIDTFALLTSRTHSFWGKMRSMNDSYYWMTLVWWWTQDIMQRTPFEVGADNTVRPMDSIARSAFSTARGSLSRNCHKVGHSYALARRNLHGCTREKGLFLSLILLLTNYK